MEMTPINTFFVLFGLLIGVFIGYIIGTMRVKAYLKKYYPEVDFQQSPKERKRILEERARQKNLETEKDQDSMDKKSK